MDYQQFYQNKDKIYYAHSRRELLPFIPEHMKTALDVGCGNGSFGSLLKTTQPCTVWGIEPDRSSAEEAKEHLDGVINALFSGNLAELEGKKFDAIFFNDVLEHLIDPAEALASCKDLLAEGGQIIASVPNIRWYPVVLSLLRNKDFKYQKAGVMDKTHLRFFTKKSMIRLFEEGGYKVHRIEGINKNTNFKVFNIINLLLLRSQEDMKYPQFVITASI